MKENTPPHNAEAEKSVIGGVLMDTDSLPIVVQEGIVAADFFLVSHQLIWSAIIDISNNGDTIDAITVSSQLKDKGELNKAGGMAYVVGLIDDCPSAANIKSHCRIVKEKSMIRQAIRQAYEIIKQASTPGATIDNIPTTLSIDRPQKIEIRHVSKDIKQLERNISQGYPGIDPGYDILRRTIHNISPGHLWIIGGYTSSGKSMFLVDFIRRLQVQNNPGIAVFSTEMSSEQYILRLLAGATSFSTWAISHRKVEDQGQARRLMDAYSHLYSRKLYIHDNLYKIEDIERTAILIKEKKGLDVIAIDYLQNLWGKGSIYERMSALAPHLQYLAKELQVTIIALSQINNESAREASGPVIGYKGAGEIAAASDLGIILERYPRDSINKDRLKVSVRKNRHGQVDNCEFEFINKYTSLREIEKE